MALRRGLGRFTIVAMLVVVLAVAAISGLLLLSKQPQSPSSSSSPSQSSTNSPSTSSTTQTSLNSTLPLQITVVTIELLSGTATNATAQGTASMLLVLHNPGPATTISSINVVRPPNLTQPKVYQCSSATACTLIASPVVNADSDTNFTSTTSAFFVGASLSPGLQYGYQINFQNGLEAFGTVDATAAP